MSWPCAAKVASRLDAAWAIDAIAKNPNPRCSRSQMLKCMPPFKGLRGLHLEESPRRDPTPLGLRKRPRLTRSLGPLHAVKPRSAMRST